MTKSTTIRPTPRVVSRRDGLRLGFHHLTASDLGPFQQFVAQLSHGPTPIPSETRRGAKPPQRTAAAAGLDPRQFSAHGLRFGYMTEAANRSVPLQEAMRQSLHCSVQQAHRYYDEVEIERGDAARLG